MHSKEVIYGLSDVTESELGILCGIVGSHVKELALDFCNFQIRLDTNYVCIDDIDLEFLDPVMIEVFGISIKCIKPEDFGQYPPVFDNIIKVGKSATSISTIKCNVHDFWSNTDEPFSFSYITGVIIWFGHEGFPIFHGPYCIGFTNHLQNKLLTKQEILALLKPLNHANYTIENIA